MKKFYSLLSCALLCAACFSLSSCDDDEYIAGTLEGTWRGNMYMQHIYNGVTYDSSYSEIYFDRNPFRNARGDGYWVDHYDTYGWGRNYVANHITWKVRDSEILIHFVEENTDLTIYDYKLRDTRFRGFIYDGDTRVYFDLYHVDSPNWDSYYYGDYYAPASSNLGEAQKGARQTMPVRQIRKN